MSTNPVWAAFPLIPWGSIGWRMGHGEAYWNQWAKWFRGMSAAEQEAYQLEWPEPKDWAGFYAFVLHGVQPSWIREQRSRDQKQQPPASNEFRVDEPDRVRWMARSYLERTNARDPDAAGSSPIYIASNGELWKLFEAPLGTRVGPFLWFERFKGQLIGPDNTVESVRTARGGRLPAAKN